MFKNLAKKLREDRELNSDSCVTSPILPLKKQAQKSLLKDMSKHALNLYERKTDIKNFTRLALSDPENNTHNEIVDKLFSNKTITDVFSDEAMFELSENSQFLKDLGL